MSALAARLRELRARRGYSQETLACRAGLSRQGIQKLENGSLNVKLSTLQQLALALDVTVDDLAPGAERPTEPPPPPAAVTVTTPVPPGGLRVMLAPATSWETPATPHGAPASAMTRFALNLAQLPVDTAPDCVTEGGGEGCAKAYGATAASISEA